MDGLTYEMLGLNRNSIGHWLPALCAAVDKQSFFKVPKTRVIKVPITMLQLSRLDYGLLTPGTMEVPAARWRSCTPRFEPKRAVRKGGSFLCPKRHLSPVPKHKIEYLN